MPSKYLNVVKNQKEYIDKQNIQTNKNKEGNNKMVLVKVWVSGYYKWIGGRRVYVKGHYKYINVPIWKMQTFIGRRKR